MTEDSSERLTSYFDKSAHAVREYSVRFEESYGRPALEYCTASFQMSPITSTFLAVFSLLSFLPIVFFISISLCVILSVAFFALAGAIATILVTEFIFISVIASTLAFLFCLSIPITTTFILTYVFSRLVFHTRSSGRAGVNDWLSETKNRFISSGSAVTTQTPQEKEETI